MAHVVCEPCALCPQKERSKAPCVLACPENAFLITFVMVRGKSLAMSVIDPVRCTDCKACVSECLERAIFHEDIVPDEWRPYTLLNYLQSGDPQAERCIRPAPPEAT